jgi:hypothetical protein
MPSKNRQLLLAHNNRFVTILEIARISACRKIKNLAPQDCLEIPGLVTESPN